MPFLRSRSAELLCNRADSVFDFKRIREYDSVSSLTCVFPLQM
jgi:hypothetical protein